MSTSPPPSSTSPLPSSTTPSLQYIKTAHYLNKLQPVLADVLEKICVAQPDDPVAYIIDSLQHLSPSLTQSLNKSISALQHDDLSKKNVDGTSKLNERKEGERDIIHNVHSLCSCTHTLFLLFPLFLQIKLKSPYYYH